MSKQSWMQLRLLSCSGPDVTVFLTLLLFSRLCDYAFAGSVFPLYYVIYLGAAALFVASRWFTSRVLPLAAFGIYAILLVTLPLLDPSFPARYKRFYREIDIGMKAEEVERLFEKRFPQHRNEGRPTIRTIEHGYGFAQDPSSASGNAELILVGIDNGVVTGKSFLPD